MAEHGGDTDAPENNLNEISTRASREKPSKRISTRASREKHPKRIEEQESPLPVASRQKVMLTQTPKTSRKHGPSALPGRSLEDTKLPAILNSAYAKSIQNQSRSSDNPYSGDTSKNDDPSDTQGNFDGVSSDRDAGPEEDKKNAAQPGRRGRKRKSLPDEQVDPSHNSEDVAVRRAYYRRNAARARHRYKESIGQLRSSIERVTKDITTLRHENRNLQGRISDLEQEQVDIKTFGVALKQKQAETETQQLALKSPSVHSASAPQQPAASVPAQPAATIPSQLAAALIPPQQLNVARAVPPPAIFPPPPAVPTNGSHTHGHKVLQNAPEPSQLQHLLQGIGGLPAITPGQSDAELLLAAIRANMSMPAPAPFTTPRPLAPPPQFSPGPRVALAPPITSPKQSTEALQTLVMIASTLQSLGVGTDATVILQQLLSIPAVVQNPTSLLQPLLQAVLQSQGTGGSLDQMK